MTFKEKLQKEHPDLVDDCCYGGCAECPYDYGYESCKPYFCKISNTVCTKCWNREMQEEEKMFTLSDLKDTNIIETRDGKRYIIINGIGVGETGYFTFVSHRADLEHNLFKEFDILKVYESNPYCRFKSLLEKPGKLIWERKKPVKEITSEEACKLLKEKFPEYDSVKITV